MADNKLDRRSFLKNAVAGSAGALTTAALSKSVLAQGSDASNQIFLPTVMTGQDESQIPPEITDPGIPTQQLPEVSVESGAQRPPNSEVAKIAEDVLNSLKYSMASVAAQPESAFISGTLEADFKTAMLGLESNRRSSLQQSASALVNASPDVRQAVFGRYGTLSPQQMKTVGFSGINSVLPQLSVDNAALGLPSVEGRSTMNAEADAQRLSDIWGPMYAQGTQEAQEVQASSLVTDKLALYINRIKCVDETNPEWWGSDEIALAGISVDEDGDAKKIGEKFIGNFNDGSQRSYNPDWQYTWFNMREQHAHAGAKWPKKYGVTLILAEKDNGGLASFLNNLWARVRDRVKAEIAKAVGAALSAYVGRAIGNAIGQAVAWIVDKVIGWLINLFNDDIFRPVPLFCTVPTYSARWTINGVWGSTTSPLYRANYSGFGGSYYIEYYWKLFA